MPSLGASAGVVPPDGVEPPPEGQPPGGTTGPWPCGIGGATGVLPYEEPREEGLLDGLAYMPGLLA